MFWYNFCLYLLTPFSQASFYPLGFRPASISCFCYCCLLDPYLHDYSFLLTLLVHVRNKHNSIQVSRVSESYLNSITQIWDTIYLFQIAVPNYFISPGDNMHRSVYNRWAVLTFEKNGIQSFNGSWYRLKKENI